MMAELECEKVEKGPDTFILSFYTDDMATTCQK